MELFLLSNFTITLITILYNRYAKTSISAKLTLSTFALICWLIPFTLIRDYLPQEVAVNVHWLLPVTTDTSTPAISNNQVSVFSQITLLHIFIASILIGLFLWGSRLVKHQQWVRKLNNHPHTKLIGDHQGKPVYQTALVNNALLIGYRRPSIWINPKLINSPYYDIIVEHEVTHIKNKDNYWLAIMAFIQSIYWWNPLLRILVNQTKLNLETRCDYKTSQSFTEGIYRRKLTELILNMSKLNQQPVSHTGFASAVISKNSNIRRLKTLKEKQKMNLFSKIIMSLLLTSSIAVLTFPVSSINLLASTSKHAVNDSNSLLLNFEQIPVVALADIIARDMRLEAVIADEIKDEIVSIKLAQPRDRILDTLTATFNISFVKQGDQLIVSPLAGGVFNNIETHDNTQGVMLNLNIMKVSKKDGGVNEKTIEAAIWTSFNKVGSIHFNDSWELDLIANEKNANDIYLEMKLFSNNANNSRKLIAEPKLLIANNSLGEVEFDDGLGNSIHFSVTPIKSAQPSNKD